MPERISCQNCELPLDKTDQYCPSCGQTTKDPRASMWSIVHDFLGDFFAFDTKIFRSVVPLLFQPGFLTREFIEGRRVRYVPPFRFYIFVSFVYFLLLTFAVQDKQFFKIDETGLAMSTTPIAETSVALPQVLQRRAARDSFLRQHGAEAEGRRDQPPPASSAGPGVARSSPSDSSSTRITMEIRDSLVDMTEIFRLSNAGLSDEVLADTLGISGGIEKLVFMSLMRLYTNQGAKFQRTLFRNLSWMMFALIPLFALGLWLLYRKSDFMFIDHIVFTLHYLTFFFVVFALLLFLSKFTWLVLLLVLALMTYLLLAQKNAYWQRWGSTIRKYTALIFLWAATLLAGVMVTVSVSFLFA